MPSPVITLVPLSGEQQSALCTASLVRILENHKTIAAAGGADLRIALLARLVAQVVPDVSFLPDLCLLALLCCLLRINFPFCQLLSCGYVMYVGEYYCSTQK